MHNNNFIPSLYHVKYKWWYYEHFKAYYVYCAKHLGRLMKANWWTSDLYVTILVLQMCLHVKTFTEMKDKNSGYSLLPFTKSFTHQYFSIWQKFFSQSVSSEGLKYSLLVLGINGKRLIFFLIILYFQFGSWFNRIIYFYKELLCKIVYTPCEVFSVGFVLFFPTDISISLCVLSSEDMSVSQVLLITAS